MLDAKWDRRFLELARHVSEWSKDTTRVGAVIANDNRLVLGLGYNGFPRGVHDHPERYADRNTKLAMIVHAEENAILNSEGSCRGATIYVYPTMMIPAACPECCKTIIQSGIKRLVQYDTDTPLSERWQALADTSRAMLHEAGVVVTLYPYALDGSPRNL